MDARAILSVSRQAACPRREAHIPSWCQKTPHQGTPLGWGYGVKSEARSVRAAPTPERKIQKRSAIAAYTAWTSPPGRLPTGRRGYSAELSVRQPGRRALSSIRNAVFGNEPKRSIPSAWGREPTFGKFELKAAIRSRAEVAFLKRKQPPPSSKIDKKICRPFLRNFP